MNEATHSSAMAIQEATQLYTARDYAKAEAACLEILERQPDHGQALLIAGLAALNTGRPALGIATLEHACRVQPGSALYHYNLAVSLNDVGRPAEALVHYQSCLRLQPGHADALWNGGELLRMRERFDIAAAYFEQLLPQAFKYRGLYHRLAVCYTYLGRTAAAEEMFKQELALGPFDESLTLWEYSHLLLVVGDFARGWTAYDRRFDSPKTSVTAHPFPFPRWNGEALNGKTLLVHGEQGLGDELMFASIVPDLLAKVTAGNGRLLLACSPSLVRIFARAWPQAVVLPHIQGQAPAALAPFGRIDFQIPVGSLARHFRNSKTSFGESRPYLYSDPQRMAYYRQKIAELAPGAAPRLRAGLVWGTNPALHHRKAAARASQKSIPIRALAPLAAVPGMQFVSLQNSELGAMAAELPELNPLDFADDLLDFAETAALIDCLDLVITVDTSVAHLAGAMGKPTWLLLMKHADWRWGRNEEDSPWYRSVRQFRQTVQGEWAPVVEKVRVALAEPIAAPAAQESSASR